jgi:hypothetical protein
MIASLSLSSGAHSRDPLARNDDFKSRLRLGCLTSEVNEHEAHPSPQLSPPGLTGRPSIPETPVIESISRGILDPRVRGDDERE